MKRALARHDEATAKGIQVMTEMPFTRIHSKFKRITT